MKLLIPFIVVLNYLTEDPVLPRQRSPPKRMDDGAVLHLFSDPVSFF